MSRRVVTNLQLRIDSRTLKTIVLVSIIQTWLECVLIFGMNLFGRRQRA